LHYRTLPTWIFGSGTHFSAWRVIGAAGFGYLFHVLVESRFLGSPFEAIDRRKPLVLSRDSAAGDLFVADRIESQVLFVARPGWKAA
jgi:hypothetical protein